MEYDDMSSTTFEDQRKAEDERTADIFSTVKNS